MKKLTIIISLCLLATGCTFNPFAKKCVSPYETKVRLGASTACIQIVSETQEMTKGLGDRQSMDKDSGMLFNFRQAATPSFWMKDMKFDIDIIWIKDGKVIAITKNVAHPQTDADNADTKLASYAPPSDINYVVEVNSGWSDKHNLKVGDSIEF